MVGKGQDIHTRFMSTLHQLPRRERSVGCGGVAVKIVFQGHKPAFYHPLPWFPGETAKHFLSHR